MSSLLPQLIPICILGLFIAKWERDKVHFRNHYGKAFYEGFAEGAKETRREWAQSVEKMATEAVGKLALAVPVAVKVTQTDEPFSRDFYTGKVTAWKDMVELKPLGITIRVDGSGPIIHPRGQDWNAKWSQIN